MTKIVFMCLALLPYTLAQQAVAESLLLSNVHLIDMRSPKIQTGMDVLVREEIIQSIKKSKVYSYPNTVSVIDCTGKYLIPGLWDMHGHLSYYGESALSEMISYGVVGVRDPGCNLEQIDRLRQEIFEGTRIGPTIIRSGPFIDGQKKMSPLRAGFTRVVTNEIEARKTVRSLKEQDVDFIKVHSRLARDLFFAVADEAKKQGLPLVVHTPKDITAFEASHAGARSIEHTESLLGSALYAEPELEWEKQVQLALDALKTEEGKIIIDRIADNKTWFTPTLIAHYRTLANSESAFMRAFPDKLFEVLIELHEAGIPLLAGSDFNFHSGPIRAGKDLHEELVIFVKAGMSPYHALETATRNAAEALDLLDSVGTVKAGKEASLVLLNQNPLDNIKNTQNIFAVIVKGKFLDQGKLLELRNHANN